MTTAPATLVRWLVDPARQEELLGDLEELAGRGTGRFWLDVASVCVRQSRLVAAVRTPSRLAAALALLACAFGLHAASLAVRATLVGYDAVATFQDELSFIACLMVGLYLLIALRTNLTSSSCKSCLWRAMCNNEPKNFYTHREFHICAFEYFAVSESSRL